MAFTVNQADNKAMTWVAELQRCDVLACLPLVNYFVLVNHSLFGNWIHQKLQSKNAKLMSDGNWRKQL